MTTDNRMGKRSGGAHTAAHRWRVTPAVVGLVVAGAVPLFGALLALLGWACGDRLDSPGMVLGVAALLASGFGMPAYREATATKPVRAAPEPAGEPAALRVQNRFGLVFWLLTAPAAVVVAFTAVFTVGVVARLARGAGFDGASGLALVGMAIVLVMAGVAMTVAVAAVPVRIMLAHKHTHLWISREGIGYRPVAGDDPGFLRWENVAALAHSDRDARGLVYTHMWTIRPVGPAVPIMIEYPAGATPRPRAIRRVIRDLAPALDKAG